MKKITQGDLSKLRKLFVHYLEINQGREVLKEEYILISKSMVEAFKCYNQDLKPLE